MTTGAPLAVMRRWRSITIGGVMIGAVVGWVSAPGSAPATTFAATHTLILNPGASNAAIYRAKVLATHGAVPDRVAGRLQIDGARARSMVSVEIPVDVARVGVLYVTGRSADRAQAEALANVTAEEVIVELGGEGSSLRTLEPAVASPEATTDVGPRSRAGRALMLGGFGLVLGVGAAFAVERFDKRIWSKSAAEHALGVPVIAEVPAVAWVDEGRLLTGAQASSFMEAYRRLRSGLDAWAARREDGKGRPVIVVTSPTGGEGTTVTVAHLATVLAESGRSVLLISADLRRPSLHFYFDRPREPGLTDLLRGAPDACRLTDLNLATDVPGIRLVPSGAPAETLAPLLDRAGDLLKEARSLADFVLVDSPPLLLASDAADLAHEADGVLLVVRAGHTTAGAAARSAHLLERLDVPVIGAVLMACDSSAYRR
jgi:capsular exopolysaccharide synthesis family protein